MQVATVDAARPPQHARRVAHVLGAPARRDAPRAGRARRRRAAAAAAAGSRAASAGRAAIYVQNLTTGAGAAWNAQATFPARVDAQARDRGRGTRPRRGDPAYGSTLDAAPAPDAGLLGQRRGQRDRALLRRLDLGRLRARERDDALARPRRHGDVRRLRARRARALARPRGGDPAPRRQPAELGNRASGPPPTTSAACCAPSGSRAAGRGPLRDAQPGFTPADARYLLYLLAHVRDPGKIDRARRAKLPASSVLHKAGWIDVGPPRQRHRALAGRRPRRDRDDLPRLRCRGLVGRARGERRRGSARRATAADGRRRAPRGNDDGAPASGRPSALAAAPSECAASRGVRSREATVREPGSDN